MITLRLSAPWYHEGIGDTKRRRRKQERPLESFKTVCRQTDDLPLFLPQNTTLTMFADDTSRTQSSCIIHELNARLNRVVSGVFAWANLNDMVLNTSKTMTKSVSITTQQKFHRLNDHSLD